MDSTAMSTLKSAPTKKSQPSQMVEGQVLEKRRKTGLRGGSKSQKQDSTRSELYSVREEGNMNDMNESFKDKKKISGASDASGARNNDNDSDDDLYDDNDANDSESSSDSDGDKTWPTYKAKEKAKTKAKANNNNNNNSNNNNNNNNNNKLIAQQQQQ